ncbi:hypothetical protein AB2N04_16950 [Nitratireductor sp. GISD-1A_MAKvit]|uniref:hypothetical protein n=1 Tax=Nitratireductor sp. GISD-1A_MAKvit TaxID=3234198 RepID=UPI0034655D47
MALDTLKRIALVFAIFNLVGISFLAWLLRPVFAMLYAAPPYGIGIALSAAFMILVVGTNIYLSVRAYRVESGSPLTWAMIVWTIVSALSGVAAGSLDIWSMFRSLPLLFQTITSA